MHACMIARSLVSAITQRSWVDALCSFPCVHYIFRPLRLQGYSCDGRLLSLIAIFPRQSSSSPDNHLLRNFRHCNSPLPENYVLPRSSVYFLTQPWKFDVYNSIEYIFFFFFYFFMEAKIYIKSKDNNFDKLLKLLILISRKIEKSLSKIEQKGEMFDANKRIFPCLNDALER